MARFCSSCGAQMVENAAFCPSCGKAVAAASAAPTGAAPAPAHQVSAAGIPVPVYLAIKENAAGALAYLIFVAAIVFLVVEPYNRNKFIRFHSFQSIFFWIAVVVLLLIAGTIPILAFVLVPIVWLGAIISMVVLMIKAFQGTMFKMPFIGDFAEKQANQ